MNPSKTHGAFSWSELMTSDPKAAVDFYAKLFGYEVQTQEMEQGPYHMLMHDDVPRAGVMGLPEPDMPPAWAFYITVNDVEVTVQKALSMGAKQAWPLTDVEGVGRMTGFFDPQGAYINIINYAYPEMDGPEPDFADAFKTHGAFSWYELRSSDLDASKQFYTTLFGWTIKDWPMGDEGVYPGINVGEVGVGGMIPPPTPGVPSHWAGYITSDDADATAAAVKEGGGSVLTTMDLPTVGRMHVITDPQGAVVNVIQYRDSNEST